jgi:biopolymer transport protein ExbD
MARETSLEIPMRFQRKTEEEYSINLPSMTDIIFLLLIFFMVATVLKDSTRRLEVQLPESRSGEVSETRIMTIEMAADGSISLDGAVMSREDLETHLQPADPTGGQRSAIIRADKRLEYGTVVEVIGLCQASGIAEIAVAVK